MAVTAEGLAFGTSAEMERLIGYVLFGIAMIRTSTLPRWSGILVAVGAPAHLLGFGIAQLVSTAAWSVAILGILSLAAGLAGSWRRAQPCPEKGPSSCTAASKNRGSLHCAVRHRHICLVGQRGITEECWLTRGRCHFASRRDHDYDCAVPRQHG